MSMRNKALMASVAVLLSSCGLFKDSAPLTPAWVQGTVVGIVDSAYNQEGTFAVGNAISVASRGDTLLVMGDNDLYTALPGQSLKRLHTTWQYGDSIVDTSPAFWGGFIGNQDSLYIADYYGYIWKVDQIGGPVLAYPPNSAPISGNTPRVIWVGSLNGRMGLAVLQDGGVYSDSLQTGKNWSKQMPSADYPYFLPFRIGDSTYLLSQDGSSLVAVSMSDLGHRSIPAPGGGSRWNFIPCDSTICAIDSMGFFRYQNNAWTRLKQSGIVEENICQNKIALDAIEYQGVTIFNTNNFVIGVVSDGNVAIRSISAGSTLVNHSIAVWNDNLVYTAGNQVLAIPMSEVLSWK